MSAHANETVTQRLAAEVTKRSEKRETAIAKAQDLYQRWCDANDLDLLPAEQAVAAQQLLRFLHSGYEEKQWAWSTCREYGIAVAELFTKAGRPDPRNRRYDAWRDALLRQQGSRRAQQPMDAIEPEQIAAVAAHREPTAQVTRLRALVTVARALGWSPAVRGHAVHRLPRTAFTVRETSIVIRTDEARGLVSEDEDPLGFECVTATLAAGTALPLTQGGTAELLTPKSCQRDDRLLRAAWQRAFNQEEVHHNSVLNAFLANCDDEQWLWWRRCLDPDVPGAVLDRAYVLLGAQQGHRHATMARLTLGHFTQEEAGFSYTVGAAEDKGLILSRSQGNRAPELQRCVPHQDPDGDTSRCGLVCAACALDDQLRARRYAGATDADPLVVLRRGSTEAPSSIAMSRRLQRLFGENTQPGQLLGTRSLRVTAAALARAAGLSLVEVAHHLGHQKPASSAVYLRWSPADGMTYVLGTDSEA